MFDTRCDEKTLGLTDRNMAPSESVQPDISVVPTGKSFFGRIICEIEKGCCQPSLCPSPESPSFQTHAAFEVCDVQVKKRLELPDATMIEMIMYRGT